MKIIVCRRELPRSKVRSARLLYPPPPGVNCLVKNLIGYDTSPASGG